MLLKFEKYGSIFLSMELNDVQHTLSRVRIAAILVDRYDTCR